MCIRDSSHPPGAVILDHDDRAGDVHFLAQGRLLAVYWTRDGREIIFSAPVSYTHLDVYKRQSLRR